MLKKRAAVTALLAMVSMTFMIGCNDTTRTNDVLFNPNEEISKYGELNNTFDKDNTVISYEQYHTNEESLQYGIDMYLDDVYYYSDPITEGIVEYYDVVNAKIAVMNDGQMIKVQDVRITNEENTWYSQIKDFIIGKNIGTTSMVYFKLSYDDNFEREDWMKEGVTYAVSVNINSVERKIYPEEINEDNFMQYAKPFLKEHYGVEEDFQSYEEFEKWIGNELLSQIDEYNFKAYRNAYSDYILDLSETATPNEEVAIEYGTKVILPYYENLAKQENLTIDEYIQTTYGVSKEEFIKEISIIEMKRHIATMEIAKSFNITITQEDFDNNVDNYYQIMSDMNGTTIEIEKQRVEDYPQGFYFMYLQEVVIKFMTDNCKTDITEQIF